MSASIRFTTTDKIVFLYLLSSFTTSRILAVLSLQFVCTILKNDRQEANTNIHKRINLNPVLLLNASYALTRNDNSINQKCNSLNPFVYSAIAFVSLI